MNKNYLQYAAVALLFTSVNPSFTMGRAIFRVAQTIGRTTVPACGLYLLNQENEEKRKDDDTLKKSKSISEAVVQEWGNEKMTQLNVPDGKLISFIYGQSWGATQEKFVIVPRSDRRKLNKALQLKNKSSFGRFFYKIRFLGDDPDRTIARHSMALKHEIGHIINKDSQNSAYKLVTIPVAVEAVFFGITSSFRKLCNIQTPKTFVKAALRSCCAVGSTVPKALVSGAAYIGSRRYQEMRADKFACKNAESRLELEEAENFFQEKINRRIAYKDITTTDVEWLMFFYCLSGRFEYIPKKIRKEYIRCFEKGLLEIVRQLEDPGVSEQRKKMLNHAFQVMVDPDHPRDEKRVANVRKYIKKWDREHQGDENRKKA